MDCCITGPKSKMSTETISQVVPEVVPGWFPVVPVNIVENSGRVVPEVVPKWFPGGSALFPCGFSVFHILGPSREGGVVPERAPPIRSIGGPRGPPPAAPKKGTEKGNFYASETLHETRLP